jgi:peptidoglycan/LPS O-acetylase OafA/YrhL
MTWLVIACVLQPDQPLGRVLTNPLIKHVGIVSYGIYLTHMLCVNAARHLVHVSYGPIIFVLGLAISIFVATLSYHFFESPFLHLKDRLAKRPDAESALPRRLSFSSFQ